MFLLLTHKSFLIASINFHMFSKTFFVDLSQEVFLYRQNCLTVSGHEKSRVAFINSIIHLSISIFGFFLSISKSSVIKFS